ncbi:hypothetical protein SK128_002137, partial [Halocaridina rubra]
GTRSCIVSQQALCTIILTQWHLMFSLDGSNMRSWQVRSYTRNESTLSLYKSRS